MNKKSKYNKLSGKMKKEKANAYSTAKKLQKEAVWGKKKRRAFHNTFKAVGGLW